MHRITCSTQRKLLGLLMAASLVTTAYADTREIGGYVGHAEDRFVRNVWNFIKNFKSSQHVGLYSWKYNQYFYAHPFEFLGSSLSYVDSMDLAFFSGHGNHWSFACTNNNADIVDLTTAPGYGTLGTGGDLEFLIFESCSVIPGPLDVADWWSNWTRNGAGKHIFQGLHQAIGYRTLSYSDNGIPNNFANRLKIGQPLWQAWFDAVDDERSIWHGSDYPGYASAVLYPGLDNDSIGFYGADPPSNHTKLRIYYQY